MQLNKETKPNQTHIHANTYTHAYINKHTLKYWSFEILKVFNFKFRGSTFGDALSSNSVESASDTSSKPARGCLNFTSHTCERCESTYSPLVTRKQIRLFVI